MSSFVPPQTSTVNMQMYCQLLEGEKEGMRMWLRTEMDSLVDPLIDKLFHKLNNRLKTSENVQGAKSGCVGTAGQVMNQNFESSPSNGQVHSQPTAIIANNELPTSIDIHHHHDALNQIPSGTFAQVMSQTAHPESIGQVLQSSAPISGNDSHQYPLLLWRLSNKLITGRQASGSDTANGQAQSSGQLIDNVNQLTNCRMGEPAILNVAHQPSTSTAMPVALPFNHLIPNSESGQMTIATEPGPSTSSSVLPPSTSSQFPIQPNLANSMTFGNGDDDVYDDDDFSEDECDCDDCVNGGIEGIIKQEDEDEDDGIDWIDIDDEEEELNEENGKESPQAVNQQQMDTTELSNGQSTDDQQNNNGQQQSLEQPIGIGQQSNQIIATNNNNTKKLAHFARKPQEKLITLKVKCLSTCSRMFDSNKELYDHMWYQHSILPKRCLFGGCGQSFQTTALHTQHLKEAHADVRLWQCDKCDKYLAADSLLQRHYYRHHQLGQFECGSSRCHFTSDNRNDVYVHFDKTHDRDVVCKMKKRKMKNKQTVPQVVQSTVSTNSEATIPTTSMQTNQTASQEPIIESVQCLHCTNKFDLMFQLEQHMTQVHSIGPFRCLIKGCTQSFDDERKFIEHVPSHTNQNNRYHCQKCPRYFQRYSNLTAHFFECHQLGLFRCPYTNCVFTGKYSELVSTHYNQKHRPTVFRCQLAGCTSRFREEAKLKAHVRAHHRPYRCKWTDCGYVHRLQSVVMDHVRSEHFARRSTTSRSLRTGKPTPTLLRSLVSN